MVCNITDKAFRESFSARVDLKSLEALNIPVYRQRSLRPPGYRAKGPNDPSIDASGSDISGSIVEWRTIIPLVGGCLAARDGTAFCEGKDYSAVYHDGGIPFVSYTLFWC